MEWSCPTKTSIQQLLPAMACWRKWRLEVAQETPPALASSDIPQTQLYAHTAHLAAFRDSLLSMPSLASFSLRTVNNWATYKNVMKGS